MRKGLKYLFIGALSVTLFAVFHNTNASTAPATLYIPEWRPLANNVLAINPIDSNKTTAKPDSNKSAAAVPEDSAVDLPFPFTDQSEFGDPLGDMNGGLILSDPSNIHEDVQFDPVTGQYVVTQKMGSLNYREPVSLDSTDYMNYIFEKQVKDYWKTRTHADAAEQQKALIPKIHVNGAMFDRIFGGNTVDIRPQGSAELIFAANTSRTQNPALPVNERTISTFNFNEKIQLNVIGNIGDKLKLTTNYNTEATFDFENQMKLEYTGHEDEIIKKIDAGNVSLPLNGSLITGSQSLFGIKTELQFGALTATSIFSQEKGQKSTINVTGGAQTTNFSFSADTYIGNKYYFLSQYFRNNYQAALANLPIITSGINITKIEVWVTNTTGTTSNIRNIVGLADLGESGFNSAGQSNLTSPSLVTQNSPAPPYYPNNGANILNPTSFVAAHPGVSSLTTALTTLTGLNFQQVKDFELLGNARLLGTTEYTFNPKLGYIALTQPLNYDQVLAVAYQYTVNGHTYQVGTFSTDQAPPNNLLVKMLKSTNVSTQVPIWNLMMKNVYSLGAYQINPQKFTLNIVYNNPSTGTNIPYIPQGSLNGKPLIQVLDLDNLNSQLDKQPDGNFDYIEGVTINSTTGTIIFPVLEPFGSYLLSRFTPAEQTTIGPNYAFPQLYDSTLTSAQQFPNLDRFTIQGSYQSSSSSDISLNTVNVPQGSVTVTAGGVKLVENVDYTVDYTLGRVKIINQGILNSGVPIQISLESNSLFSIQSKTLLGTHLNYQISKDFNIGATVLNLTEKPLTTKVNIGDEPISNTIFGFDGSYKTNAPFLTRMVDAIPFIHTKAPSSITATGEFADLIPGHPSVIGKDGTSYIDDFEGAESEIALNSSYAWTLASTPSTFPEGNRSNDLTYGMNRAKLAWYTIDPLFQVHTTNITPASIDHPDSMSNNFTRQVLQTELFPNIQSSTGQPQPLPTFDLAFYPSERGPYNYDVNPTSVSAGIDPATGNLKDPQTRWGGITRAIQTNDFVAANIDFVQFWVMDPFNSDNHDQNTTGALYVDLGDVSEDILKDGRMSFENGLPTDAADAADSTNGNNPWSSTAWGHVPNNAPLINAFSSDPNARPYQDVGLDGLTDAQERVFFASYLSALAGTLTGGTGNSAYAVAHNDPSSDDYHYYRGDDYDGKNTPVLQRYLNYNGKDGNSPTQQQYQSLNSGGYPTTGTTLPDNEDINADNTMSQDESYYEYKVNLTPSSMTLGQNFITDIEPGQGTKADGTPINVKWYQIRIPIEDYISAVGGISNFNSIRFIRMYFKGFDKPIICRFADLSLVRDEWRGYDFSLQSPGEVIAGDGDQTSFNIGAVSIENNANRVPVNYVLPPGIVRDVNVQSANLVQMNEQSMTLNVCNLQDGDARAAYRNTSYDLRNYKNLQMYIHAEAGNPSDALNNGDVHGFIRLGSDYNQNYYEYDLPLQVTPPGLYNTSNQDDQYKVWPLANQIDLAFADLEAAKEKRDIAMASNRNITLATPYEVMTSSGAMITIVGNPDLSSVKAIMIGVRNPQKGSQNDESNDDGQPKCANVWVDELRVSGFNEKGGWASNARVTAQLADFGSITATGNISTPGFGSIEENVSERSMQTTEGYNLSSALQLGKFFPEKLGIQIPMYVGQSETFITPEYNPLDPDILMSSILNDPNTSTATKDSLKAVVLNYTKQQSLNFTNVRKLRSKTSKKAHFYDVSNIALNYAYTESYHRDVNIDHSLSKSYRGGLTYAFSPKPKNVRPLQKNKWLAKYKSLMLIRDFNFNTAPSLLSFSTNIDREYAESLNRNVLASDIFIQPTYEKTFTMSRLYNFKYDLTKSLSVDFNADNESRVMEPNGSIDTQEKRDSVERSFFEGGTNISYRHGTNVNYEIPINKLPYLNFITANARYSTNYDWLRSPFLHDTTTTNSYGEQITNSIGNTIQNANTIQLNGQFNMTTFYNNFSYFKKLNEGDKKNNSRLNMHNNKANTKNGSNSKAKQDSTKNDDTKIEIVQYLARALTALKTIGITYSQNAGTLLPGYNDSTKLMGLNPASGAPGFGFLFGQQKKDFAEYAGNQNWIVKNPYLNLPFTASAGQNLNIRANLEPFPDLKIDLVANRTESQSLSEFYQYDTITNGQPYGSFAASSPTTTGTYSISYLTWRTAFSKTNASNFSQVFANFLNDRITISQRLGALNPNAQGTGYDTTEIYRKGYGAYSQDVLIPAFLAAYSGKSPNNIGLTAFPSIPLPNWQITYTGFIKYPFFKKHFDIFTVSSAYRSAYSVGSYTSNLLFPNPPSQQFPTGIQPFSNAKDSISNNYQPAYLISIVDISEQFSPLIKIEMTFKNSILANVEIKKSRDIALSIASQQLTEIDGSEYDFGSGYRFKKLTLPFKLFGKPVKSDLNLKADVAFQNNETVMRNIVENVSQVTSGQDIITIKFSADYMVSTRLTVQAFFNKIINNPLISSTFPTSNANSGISIRFTL